MRIPFLKTLLVGMCCTLGSLGSGCAATKPSLTRPPETCAASAGAPAPLELIVLGSGGPRSFGRAGSAYLVLVAGVPRILVDAGPGASVRLGALGVDQEPLDTFLLTHLHVDHAGDLPGLVKGRDLSFRHPLTFRVFGPSAGSDYPATSELIAGLFGEQHGAFRYLAGFRNRLDFEVHDVSPAADAPPTVVLEETGLRVSAIAVDHADVPALAFRIDAGGHSIVISGDLGTRSDAMVAFARDADVLVYDAAVLDPPAAPPILYELHTSPTRIGEIAARAGVGNLVLSHLTPSVEANRDAVLQSIRRSTPVKVTFAEDCLRVTPGKT